MSRKEAVAPTEPQIEAVGETPGSTEPQRSFISQGIALDGKVSGKEDLVIRGTFKGEIHLPGQQVSIEQGGRVEANVQAESVVIQGVFKGKLNAGGLVQLGKTAQFEGELESARLQMQDGAKLKGSVKLQKG